MQYPELPIFAFISALLVIIPLPWHWRARNVAVLALMFWLFSVNIIYGVNAIVWAGNVRDPIPVWCDISRWLFFVRQDTITNTDFHSYEDRRWCLLCIASLYIVYL